VWQEEDTGMSEDCLYLNIWIPACHPGLKPSKEQDNRQLDSLEQESEDVHEPHEEEEDKSVEEKDTKTKDGSGSEEVTRQINPEHAVVTEDLLGKESLPVLVWLTAGIQKMIFQNVFKQGEKSAYFLGLGVWKEDYRGDELAARGNIIVIRYAAQKKLHLRSLVTCRKNLSIWFATRFFNNQL
jgi:hypothetical protein